LEEMRLQMASENRPLEMMRTWRGVAVRSRCGQWRQEKLGRKLDLWVYQYAAI